MRPLTVATAVFTALVLAGLTTGSAGAGTSFNARAAASSAGQDAYAPVFDKHGRLAGYASFKFRDPELFIVCDVRADGKGVTGTYRIRSLDIIKKRKDNNGSKPPCNKKRIPIKEGRIVEIRACLEDGKCSGWKEGRS
ncbi:hypothetical protein [Spongiactinospora sp. 9N601]|uniref:hypothetical protein n=1 Tax=Spongiactinospora sp. 9N601 TaxID=3375149 RepID=UPI0037A49492